MNILALETCSPTGGVSLILDGRIVGHTFITTSRGHSLLLNNSIQKLMELNSLSWNEMDAVAVSEGPGSFTGVRLGLTVAKSFCLGGIPKLIMVPTLEAFAHRMFRNQEVDLVMPTMNARRNELYLQLFEPLKGTLKAVSEPQVISADKISELEKMKGKTVLVAGEGFRSYKENFDALDCELILADSDLFDPHPDGVGLLGIQYFTEEKFADPATAEPYYLRAPSVSTPKKNRMKL